MADLVYLREVTTERDVPHGHVIGMTMPLQPMIKKRWDEGVLERVTADGKRWPEGDVPPGHAPAATAPMPGPAASFDAVSDLSGEPERPRGNARTEEWAAYVVAIGAADADAAGSMTATELKALAGE